MEDELRLSDDVQARYAMEPESWDWKWKVTDEVQRMVCNEFGFANCMAEGLDLLRSSTALFSEDEDIKQAAHYLRNNIHSKCSLPVGCVVPDVALYTLAGQEARLHDVVKKRQSTVVIAGSHT